MIHCFTYDCPDQVALVSDVGESITYAAIKTFSENMRGYVSPRSLVFILCTNTPGSLCGYLSFLENRAVPLMLNSGKGIDIVSTLLEIYHPNYLWLPSILGDLCSLGETVYSKFGYSLVRLHAERLQMNEDLGLLLATSGSTGDPKLVRLSYDNFRSNAESIGDYLEITQEERPITSLPMYYSYGLSVINSHLMKGATLLLTDKSIMQKGFWDFLKEKKATSISGVPYTYEMLKRLRVFRMDLPHLKTMTQAGGKLNPTLVKEFVEYAKHTGKKFIVMYGQTEATARMSYLPFEFAEEKYSSIGKAIPGGEFKLVDSEKSEILECNVDGELVYRGANVSLGYAECLEDLAIGDENKGVLHTGDVARRDEEGFYYITGRMKRFVKIYGNRVNLDAIEQIVKSVAPNSACGGVDDKLIIFTTDADKIEQIKALLIKKTDLNVQAFSFKVLDEIPKNHSGKVRYAELNKVMY